MNEISVSLALLDFVPVALCGIVVIVLLKDFYSRMTAWQYSFFSAGSFILIFGGFLKAVQKLIYALEICDLAVLKEQFFLNQSLAFIFLSIATFGMLIKNKKDVKLYSAVSIPVITSHLPYIILMALGLIVWYIGLIIYSVRLKSKKGVIFILCALVVMLINTRLGAKFDNSKGILHWIAESFNSVAQTFLLAGTITMHKAMQLEDAEKAS